MMADPMATDPAPASPRPFRAAASSRPSRLRPGWASYREPRYMLAAQNFGLGQWIGNKWVNGHISGVITHPHVDRGVNDYFFGKSTNNGAWNVDRYGYQKLQAEFACVVECDWSDELYDHIVFRPFYYCAPSTRATANPFGWAPRTVMTTRAMSSSTIGRSAGSRATSSTAAGARVGSSTGFMRGPGAIPSFVARRNPMMRKSGLAWISGMSG